MGKIPESRCVCAEPSKGGFQQWEHPFETFIITNLPTGYLTAAAGILKISWCSRGPAAGSSSQVGVEAGIATGGVLAGPGLLAAACFPAAQAKG